MPEKKKIATQEESQQLLLFYIKGDIYAMEALQASEIVEFSTITKVPKMERFVKGVTNIRGNIVAVVDLADRFGFGESEIGPRSSIVVVNHRYVEDEEERVMQIGVIIDEVYEVDHIERESIKPPPEFGSKIERRFIASMGKYNGDYIAVLDMDTILDTEELSKVRKGM